MQLKKKRRYARLLNDKTLVIDATDKELELVRQGKLQLERLKVTPKYTVCRIKR